ncbi:MAG: hypothetical protein JSS29_17935 [Proteobacteria bacterium]|nr:hypothetical protein [Pseudomonadota bacterium]
MNRTLQLIAGLAAITVTLAGCDTLGVALGLRMRLAKAPVTAIIPALVPDTLSPGAKGELVVTATTADGHTYATEGVGNGRVTWDSFIFTPTVVAMKGGTVTLPADPRASDGQKPRIGVAVVGHPEVTATLNIPVRYDVAFASHHSGANGFPGIDGTPGMDGSSGMSGSADPNNPTPGGNGGDGSRGGDGGNGGDGAPGPAVAVAMRLREGSPALLEFRVSAAGKDQYYLVNPAGGSLAIDANGGAGGRAGSGGRGGRGGSGGSGSPPGMSGFDGMSGSDGRPGSAGAAGSFTVTVDPAAQPYLNVLTLTNHDGNGRAGKLALIEVAPVATLW